MRSQGRGQENNNNEAHNRAHTHTVLYWHDLSWLLGITKDYSARKKWINFANLRITRRFSAGNADEAALQYAHLLSTKPEIKSTSKVAILLLMRWKKMGVRVLLLST